MAEYTIGARTVTVGDIKDINPAPEQMVVGHPMDRLGEGYVRLGKANAQDAPALNFSAGSTVVMPHTSDVKESERGGQLGRLITAGLVAVVHSAFLGGPGYLATDEKNIVAINVTPAP